MRTSILAVGLWGVSVLAMAQQMGDRPPVLKGADGQTIEPEVTIIETSKERIYEYRINGAVYMLKVQPVAGPAYYLVDTDGDGTLETHTVDPRNININQWTLFRW